MQTKLSRICDAIIEAGWLAALIVSPLFFNTFSNRVFEPDKIHLVRSIALVMAVAWVVQLLDVGLGSRSSAEDGDQPAPGLWTRIRGTPLVRPALILVAAYLLSTALSVVPRISLVGSYVRMQGAFSFLSYVVIFAMILTHLRSRSQVNRLIYAVILTSLPISIYGIIQHFNLDALPWGGDVTERVAANMGNAIFVAAYLLMAVFLTLERLVDSVAALLSAEHGSTADALRAGVYLFVLAVQLIAIVFTQSRGPWLGLAAGLYVFGLLGMLLLGRWAANQPRAPRWISAGVRPAWCTLIGLTILLIAFVGVLNVQDGPLSPLCEKQYIDRVCTLTSLTEGTNAVRVLIWEGVVDMMLKPHAPIQYPDGSPDTLNVIRPLIGYGPESMWVAYNRFYPPDLAHYEARNASPDRSHNETFDTLVQTGLIGFGVQLLLFGSVFYYALRWLGLMRGAGRRNLFVALLAGGAMLGVIIPWLADGSLRLAGLGLPVGLIAGLIIYVTVDLLLTPQGQAREGPDLVASGGRRQLLILAIFAAIVAHFVEVHFGIAIAATRTHFWVLSAVLVVAGMGWLDQPAANEVGATLGTSAARQADRAQPAGGNKRRSKRARAERRAARQPETTQRQLATASQAAAESPICQFLPYALIGAVVTLVLTWNYLLNQTGAQGIFAILWNAFTARIDNTTYQIMRSPTLLMLLIFTWLVGALLALTESAGLRPDRLRPDGLRPDRLRPDGLRPDRLRPDRLRPDGLRPDRLRPDRLRPAERRFPGAANTGIYVGMTVGTFLVYGLIQAGRLQLSGLSGMDIIHRVASHIVAFDLALLISMLGLALVLWLADLRPRPAHAFHAIPAVPLVGGVLAAVVALLIIVDVNIRTVQADTYYKQGLAYEGANSWDGAVALYLRSAQLEPQEDYYYLFLGRALLQLASTAPAGMTPTLSVELENVKTSDLLPLIELGTRTRDQEDLMRTAHAALVTAQRLNPLNTDHAANLARLSRAWAFTKALGPADVPSNAVLHQIVQTRPQDVDMDRLAKALAYYGEATSLSPQNAQLWNELATVQFIRGDTETALATLDHSLTLDDRYPQTYLQRADLLAATGDRAGALVAYRQAAVLQPLDVGVQSAVGVFSAQTGDTEGALSAFQRVVEVESQGLATAESQSSQLETLVNRAGGYTMLLPAAANRRDALQRSIAELSGQLHLNYRNMAIVLRDAGRFAEALHAAQAALPLASETDRPTIEALIADLQKRLTP
ncbi:MAG: hypothetical protein CVU38_07120 [Chloroflexi bacterium HGW-Chloroflexi-1]|nr:MAG: hypothetical protein CVU38_07120 [Chloroflexi bacterium HGW-Chloroflexi-1]